MQLRETLGHVGRAGRAELGTDAVHWRLLLAQQCLRCLPLYAGARLRTAVYRLLGFRIGAGTLTLGHLNLWGDRGIYGHLTIGRECCINPCSIGLNASVLMGDRVVLGPGVTIVTASHRMDDPSRRAGELDCKPVSIGDGVWIAANVTILPGVTIGPGAVVGAGSVVSKDVPAHTLVAGNPMRVIRALNAPDAGDS